MPLALRPPSALPSDPCSLALVLAQPSGLCLSFHIPCGCWGPFVPSHRRDTCSNTRHPPPDRATPLVLAGARELLPCPFSAVTDPSPLLCSFLAITQS